MSQKESVLSPDTEKHIDSTHPHIMTFIAHDMHDGKAPLKLKQCPCPKPTKGDVLIQIAAAGVNRLDLLQRLGRYMPARGASQILGVEVSGVIVKTTRPDSRFRPGDAVCALLPGGGYAHYAVAEETHVLPIPAPLDFVQSGGLVESVLTVWSHLFKRGKLSAGESILLHGASGGVGCIAIQMAKAAQARVFVTTRSKEKKAFLEKMGADAVFYLDSDKQAVQKPDANIYAFCESIKALGGVNIVFDMLGGHFLQASLDCLTEYGRLINIGFLQGAQSCFNLAPLVFKNLTVHGASLRGQSKAQKTRLIQEVEKTVWPWIKKGWVKPVLDSHYAFSEAEQAHQRLKSPHHMGKIILTPEKG